MHENNESQVTFKLTGEQLEQLDEFRRASGRSRHLVARELMLQGLQNGKKEHQDFTSEIAEHLRLLGQLATEDRQITEQLAQYVTGLAEQCEQTAQAVLALSQLQEALRQDVATGVLALLVQAGQPADKAMDWVQQNLYGRG